MKIEMRQIRCKNAECATHHCDDGLNEELHSTAKSGKVKAEGVEADFLQHLLKEKRITKMKVNIEMR